MEKVKWGVMGTAGIAQGCTIPGMVLAENCELTAIAGRNLEKAEAFRKEFGFARAYGSYEELLADEEIQAVYIPLPNQLHYDWTIRALKAGKHVLCEKPLAPTPEQIEEMIRVANENGVWLMEAFAYLHSPLMTALREEVRQKTIGDVVYMENAFVYSDYVSNIRMERETYGGGVYDLGCYCTTQMLWILEEEPQEIKAIATFAKTGVDTLTNGILTFADGKKGSFTCGLALATDQHKRIDRLIIHGTNGSIHCDAQFNQCGTLSYTVKIGETETVKTVDVPQNYQLEVEQMGRCILEGEKPYVTNDFTVKNSRVLDKILHEIGYF